MSINVIIDRIPEIIARMGRLTIDSPIRDCLVLRRDVCEVNRLLKEIPREERSARADLIYKIRDSSEHRHYHSILKGLQLSPGFRSRDELMEDLEHLNVLLK